MLLKNYKFKFKLFPTSMFVITFCGFIILGFWQIDRADQKNNINTNYTDRQQEAPIVLDKFNVLERASEVYHYSNEGECSWYDFAKEIVNISGVKCTLSPIKTEDYPTAAQRPKYALMSKKKISKEFDLKIISWKDSLKYCMNNLSTAPLLNKD